MSVSLLTLQISAKYLGSQNIETHTQKAGVAILISDRAGPRERDIIRDAGGRFLPIKGPILQEDTAILNVYAPNNRASNYVRPTLIEPRGKADKSVWMVRDFSISISSRSSRQKISADKVELHSAVSWR